MPYPREIYLGEDREREFAIFIEGELIRYYADTSQHIDDLKQWQKDYWAKPTNKVATFPFKNASTIIIPMTAIAVEAVHARTETQLFSQQNLIVANSISDEWDAAQKPVEDYFNRLFRKELEFKRKMSSCLLEGEKFGTMIGKVGYQKLVRKGKREVGDTEEEFDVVYKDGAVFDAIADSRFIFPYYSQDTQSTILIGEEHSDTAYEVQKMELSGLFRPGTILKKGETEGKLKSYIENVSQSSINNNGNEFDRNQRDLEKTNFSFSTLIDWVELWVAWPVDDSNMPHELVVHYHRPSSTFMSIRYNYLSNLRRPYRTGVYFPIEHRSRGVGICKMNEQFQRTITVRHRQNIDNATLANIRMFKISKLSGYGNQEPIFPGKMWFLDNMDHLDTIQLGEIYPSGYNVEQSDVLYSQQRSGVNEVTLGMPQVGTPGTATSDLARIQEGNRKADLWYGRVRDFVDDVIMDVADIQQQFGPRNILYYDTASNGELVRQFFNLPNSYIRDGLVLELKTSSQMHNKVLDRQNWQQIAGFLQQYYQGLIAMAQPLGQPELIGIIFTKGLSAITEAMRQILETYDVRNIDRIIVKELDMVIQDPVMADKLRKMGGLNATQQLPPGASDTGNNGSSQNGGMDPLAAVLSSFRGGSQNGLRRFNE